MKRLLWLLVSLLLISSVAMADHIGVFSDANGTSCNIGPAGFNTNATIIHKYSLGTVGSRFKIELPPGSVFISFSAFVPCEFFCDGQTFPYGQCLSGSVVIGTITAIYASGTLKIVHPDNAANVQYTDCAFGEYSATGGTAYVGIPGDPCIVAVEPSTWGSVKALYR